MSDTLYDRLGGERAVPGKQKIGPHRQTKKPLRGEPEPVRVRAR